MRRWVLGLAALTVLAVAGGAYAFSLQGTLREPRESCGPSGTLRLVVGQLARDEQGLDVFPLIIRNEGDSEERVWAGTYGGSYYRVRWDGRLVPLSSLRTVNDFFSGYEGTPIPPGGAVRLGEVQAVPGAQGRMLVGAYVDDLCVIHPFRA